MTGGWRKMRNEELQNMCSSPTINKTIKSKRMKLAGNVAGMGEKI
jgi:hypothetical protein